MKYLAIDASTEACSVALSDNGTIISRFEHCPQSHSILLLPMIDEVLKAANYKLTDLDGLIFGRGPGSFTGVRIGVGVTQGLAFAADLPVVGISTLQTMAQQAYQLYGEKQVVANIDARMNEIYTGYFALDNNDIMQEQCPEAVILPSVFAEHYQQLTLPVYAVGTGWDAYSELLSEYKSNTTSPDVLLPDAKTMLLLGIQAFAEGKGVAAEDAQPVYVRDTVSWKKLPGRE